VLDHDVRAGTARPVLDGLDDIVGCVVDDRLGAQPAGELELGVARGGGDDVRAERPGDHERG
jgi:hypothetical protein